ncbi:MAG: CHASE2 domain-containing protein [Chitinophagaceae bacterium]
MLKIPVLLLLYLTLTQCRPSYNVDLTGILDPDMALVNIEQSDRASLGELLKKIDSCKPAVIAINVYFTLEKDRAGDSILMSSLRSINNDLLIYWINPEDGKLMDSSHTKFSGLATECRTGYEVVMGLKSYMVPVETIEGTTHELLPLKIVQLWKPGFKHDLKNNEWIAIHFTRTLDQYYHINGSDFNVKKLADKLKNKIIILGYTGPGKEDKFFTPIRLEKNYPDSEPDTYGSVILANAIRTILEYEIKQ